MNRLLLTLMVLSLAGCAGLAPGDGQCQGPTRPANPYGSVLSPPAPPTSSPEGLGGGCGGLP